MRMMTTSGDCVFSVTISSIAKILEYNCLQHITVSIAIGGISASFSGDTTGFMANHVYNPSEHGIKLCISRAKVI